MSRDSAVGGSSPRGDTADHGEGGRRPPSRVSRLGSPLRRRAARGPCDGARPGRRGRRGCASARGNRGPSPADGCSAGTYACSLELQVVRETVLNQGATCRALYVQDVGASDMAQPVNGTGDRCAGQTEPFRCPETPRFPQRSHRRPLRLWKIKVHRAPSGGIRRYGMGKPALQPTCTPVDEPVDNKLRSVIDVVGTCRSPALLRGEGSHR
jgi:hypothetical protein